MSSKYRLYGPLGFSYKARDFRRWVLLFPGGDELTLARKRYAVMAAKAVLARGGDIRIFEETVMRTIMPSDEVREDSFRIEMEWEVKPLPLTTSPLHFPTDRLKEAGEIPIHDDLLKQMKRDYPIWRSQMLGVPDMSDDKTKE